VSDQRVEHHKTIVQSLVERVINEWRIEEIDSIFSQDAASRARKDFTSFRGGIFPIGRWN
jgi:hypothetical protein